LRFKGFTDRQLTKKRIVFPLEGVVFIGSGGGEPLSTKGEKKIDTEGSGRKKKQRAIQGTWGG